MMTKSYIKLVSCDRVPVEKRFGALPPPLINVIHKGQGTAHKLAMAYNKVEKRLIKKHNFQHLKAHCHGADRINKTIEKTRMR